MTKFKGSISANMARKAISFTNGRVCCIKAYEGADRTVSDVRIESLQTLGEESNAVKKIEAIIRHFRLEEVAAALVQLGISGITVMDVRGNVHRRSADNPANGTAEFLPKVVIEVIVPVEQLRPVIDTIQRVARTGQTGDGKIMVSDLVEVVRVRTGEKLDATLAVSA